MVASDLEVAPTTNAMPGESFSLPEERRAIPFNLINERYIGRCMGSGFSVVGSTTEMEMTEWIHEKEASHEPFKGTVGDSRVDRQHESRLSQDNI